MPRFLKIAGVLAATCLPPVLALNAQEPPPASRGERPAAKTAVTTDPAKPATDPIERIKEEGLKRSQVMATLSYLTDVIGPRLTGSPNMKRANEWTRDKLAAWGLANAHLEAWGPFGRGWSLKRFSAQVIEPQCIPLIGFPKAWSPGTDGTLDGTGRLLRRQDRGRFRRVQREAQRGDRADRPDPRGRRTVGAAGQSQDRFRAARAGRRRRARRTRLGRRGGPGQAQAQAAAGGRAGRAGRSGGRRGPRARRQPPRGRTASYGSIQLARVPRSEELQRKKTQFLAERASPCWSTPARKATAAHSSCRGHQYPVRRLPAPGQTGGRRVSPYDKDAPKIIPQLVLSKEHYNRLVRMCEQGEKLKMAVDLAVQFHDDDLMAYNTVAEIPGTDLKDELVMLGGHMDSWHSGTGATDNGAGVSVAMEADAHLAGAQSQAAANDPDRPLERRGRGAAGLACVRQGTFRQEPGQQSVRRWSSPGRQRRPRPQCQRQWQLSAPRIRQTRLQSPSSTSSRGTSISITAPARSAASTCKGNEAVRPIFRKWLQPFREMGAATLTISNTGGTDHLSFDGIGLPGFQFIQDEIEYDTRTHHSNQDVFDRIQADDMKQASVIMAAFVYNAAMAEQKMPRKPAPTPAAGTRAPVQAAAVN